jgi:AbiV family abortive infection protein
MPVTVTPQYLLEGAVYALEQCGLLLRDANTLYRSSSYASTVVMAAFAREELGRSRILFDLRKQVIAGKKFTVEEIREHCEDHVSKQRAGMLSTVMRTVTESGLGKLLQVRMKTHPQSTESREASAELDEVTDRIGKRTPQARHEQRIAALYVQPDSVSGKWNRPGMLTSLPVARDFLTDAVNDYSGLYQNRYNMDLLRGIDPELCSALEQWPDRPKLLAPEWPAFHES